MMMGRRTIGAVGLLASAGAIWAVAGCADEPTRSAPLAAQEAVAPPALAISDERAGMLQAALGDARGRSLPAAVERAEARAELDDALAALSAKVDARDRRGVNEALRAARDVGGELVLAKIAAMPIREWSYKAQDPSIRHLGPTAQDFRAAFGLGESDTTITTTDIDGVNLLAVQALGARTERLQAETAELRQENAELARQNRALRAALARVSREDADLARRLTQLEEQVRQP